MRFTASLLLGASLAWTVAALPASAAKAADAPELVDLAPFKSAAFASHGVMTAEEAEAMMAKNKAENAAAASSSLVARNTNSESAKLYEESRRASTCKNPEVRIEWRSFPHEHRLAWVKAARCLYDLPPKAGFPHSKSLAEDMQYLHQQLMETIHDVGHFNAWHRYFLYVYQEMLRDRCGYGRERPLPWWDESLDSGRFVDSPLFGPDYYGDAPKVVVDKDGKEKATCVSTGPFANLTLHIGPMMNFTDHCLSRAINETRTAWTGKAFVELGNSYTDYWQMAFAQDEYPHRGGHEGIGSVMGDIYASPGDPLFYMHHTFIDRNWWAWQKANPVNRTFLIGGYNSTTEPKELVHMKTPLRYMGLVPDLPLQATMNTESGAPFCYTYNY